MTSQKIEKINAKIASARTRLTEQQSKLRDLEREKIRLENVRIVEIVRGEKISDAELNALMQSIRSRAEPDPEQEITTQEDLRDAIIEK